MAEQNTGLELYLEGKQLFDQAAYEPCIAVLEKALLIEDHIKTRELLGSCYSKLGMVEKALAEYKKAHALNPRANKTGLVYVTQLIEAGQIAVAQEVLIGILEHSPHYAPAKKIWSQLYSGGNASRSKK